MPGEVFIQALRTTLRVWIRCATLNAIAIAGLLGWYAAGVPQPVRQAFARLSGEGMPLTSWADWLGAAGFGILFPLILSGYAILVGSQLMAGKEEREMLALVLAFPIPRWRIVIEKALGLTAGILLASTLLRLCLIIPALIWPTLAISAEGLTSASFELSLPAILIGNLALAVASANGRLAYSRWVSLSVLAAWSGLVFLSRLVNGLSFLSPLTESLSVQFPTPNPALARLALICTVLLSMVWIAAARAFAQRDLSE